MTYAIVQTITQDDSIATLVISAIALVILTACGVLAEIVRRSLRSNQSTIRETNNAVHDATGQSVAAKMDGLERQIRSMNQRVESNEGRITDLSTRVAHVEDSTAAAHRRIDQLLAVPPDTK